MNSANSATQTENPVVWRAPQYYNVKKKQPKHIEQQQQAQPQQQPQQHPQQSNLPPQQLIPRSSQPQQQSEPSDLNLSNILHYLQSEWRRYERDRNEWEIERAEMRARLALLEGEKRATDNVKSDLFRRVKMLEYALRQERAKFIALSNPRSASPKSANSAESNGEKNADKAGVSAIHPTKKASLNNGGSDSQKSDDSPLLSSTNTLLNHTHNNPSLPQWLKSTNHSKDTKTRTKSRQYLQQCLEEITYLTDPSTLNPLTGRPYKDIEGLEIEKLPQSVPMESSSPSNSIDLHSSDKIDKQFSNNFTIQESDAGPIVSQPIVETEETVRAQLATPSGPMSPPVITSNIVDEKTQNQPEEHDDEQDDQTVIDERNDTNDEDVDANPDADAETTFTQSTHFNNEKDTTKSNEINDEDTNKEEKKDNLIKSEDPMNADAPAGIEADTTAEQHVTEEVATPTHEPTNTTEDTKVQPSINLNHVDDDNDTESLRSTTSSMSSSQGLWKAWKTLRSHIDAIRAVVFKDLNAEQLLMITAGDDTVLKYWRVPKDTSNSEEILPSVNLRGHTGPITSVAASKTKNVVYTSSIDTTLREWELTEQDGDVIDLQSLAGKVYEGHTNAIWGVVCTSTAKIISAGSDSTVKIWNEKTAELENSINVGKPCSSIDLYEEGEDMKLVVGLTANSAILIDLKNLNTPFLEFVVDDAEDGANAQFNDVILDDDRMYSAHEDGKIRLWLLPGGQRIETLIAHLDSCTAIKFQPNSQILASASHDCSIRFWSTDKFSQIHSPGVAHDACVQECGGHRKVFSEGVIHLALTADGTLLASVGADGSIKLYYK